MKNKVIKYIFIVLLIAVVIGGISYFYHQEKQPEETVDNSKSQQTVNENSNIRMRSV